MQELIGTIIIAIGLILIAIGLIGIYKFKYFYTRITIASIIDTAGFMTVTIGIIVLKGIGFFSFKVLFILILMLLLNPLASHTITRGAYTSGYRIGDDDLC